MRLPENCVFATRFGMPKGLIENADPEIVDEYIRYDRRAQGREIGRLIAEQFEWKVMPGDPEVHSLSVIVLTEDQLADIINQVRQEERDRAAQIIQNVRLFPSTLG